MNFDVIGMDLAEINRIILLILLIGCAIAVNLTRNLLQAVIIFMSYSSIMCLLWILMESPDLAITEAAVGAGVSGFLFLVTLKKIHQMDAEEQRESGAKSNPEANLHSRSMDGRGKAVYNNTGKRKKGKRT